MTKIGISGPQSQDDFLKANPHLTEFIPFLDALNLESSRGAVLISTGFLEEQLRRVLVAFMRDVSAAAELVDGANAPLGTFSARIAACFALGLIDEREHHDLTTVRKIRNEFAHKIHTSFDDQAIADRCATLRGKAPDYPGVIVNAKGQFITDQPDYAAHQSPALCRQGKADLAGLEAVAPT